MARTYSRTTEGGYGEIDMPDWELLGRAIELITPYIRDAAEGGKIQFTAQDERGSYGSATLDEFRQEVDGQDERPQAISFVYSYAGAGDEERLQRYHLRVRRPGFIHSGVFALSEGADEAVVALLTERSDLLLRKAAERRRTRRQSAARRALAGTASTAPGSTDIAAVSAWEKYALPILILVVGTVIGGLILAAVLGAFH